MATRLSAQVMCITTPLSGSSERWSLQGSQQLRPSPSSATVIQGRPWASLVQIQPPPQGGRTATLGTPENLKTTVSTLPDFTVLGKLTWKTLPSRVYFKAFLPQ